MNCSHCKREISQRTNLQNNALHLYFKLLSDELINASVDLRELVREDVDIIPTPEALKLLWKQLQKAMLNKESTTQLTKGEVDKVFEVFAKLISERAKVYIPFPSIKALEDNL